MKKYEPAELELVIFENADVVTESGDTDTPWIGPVSSDLSQYD